MNPLIVIIGFIIGLTFVLSYGWMRKVLYKRKYAQIFKAHQLINYPAIEKTKQFEILDTEDTKSISGLTEFEFVPHYLLNEYITIDPEEYVNHLKATEIYDKLNFDKLEDKLTDGFYIEQRGEEFYYLINDRRSRVYEIRFKNLDKLIRYIAYYRLTELVPKYKKLMNKSFYA